MIELVAILGVAGLFCVFGLAALARARTPGPAGGACTGPGCGACGAVRDSGGECHDGA